MSQHYFASLAAALCLMLCVPQAGGEARGWLQEMRQRNCGAVRELARLRDEQRLDEAAHRWSRGATLQQALLQAGYRADAVYGLTVTGTEAAARSQLNSRHCAQLQSAAYRDVGVFERGATRWIILASPYDPPTSAQASRVSAEALRLVNLARSRAHRCGSQLFAATGPLQLAPLLTQAAAAHATDMARHERLDHRGSDGSNALQRVRTAGYQPRRVGENIASGPASAAEAIDGWLASPGHCSNLMNGSFSEMGLAFADSGPAGSLYWVQVLAAPR